MDMYLTPNVLQDMEDLKRKQPKIYRRIQNQLKRFKQNPTYPSLRTHKLKGNLGEYWSISIKGDLRMLYRFNQDGVIFFDIGTHDEVYRK